MFMQTLDDRFQAQNQSVEDAVPIIFISSNRATSNEPNSVKNRYTTFYVAFLTRTQKYLQIVV
uniref:Uncharacterized protein n=1 Tax=Romanomermis culicivorax TaxID=13658 RepID=A0A915KJG6_ROMCU